MFEGQKRFAGLYQDGYPLKLKAMVMVDAPWIMTAILKICRLFLKKKVPVISEGGMHLKSSVSAG